MDNINNPSQNNLNYSGDLQSLTVIQEQSSNINYNNANDSYHYTSTNDDNFQIPYVDTPILSNNYVNHQQPTSSFNGNVPSTSSSQFYTKIHRNLLIHHLVLLLIFHKQIFPKSL